jgi:phenylacetate-CoA ligase
MMKEILKKKLVAQLEYTLSKSRFYQSKFREIPADAGLSEAFKDFPFTDKQELLTDQEHHPPFGANLCVSLKDCRRIHKTSGTTNKPLLIVMTDNDIATTVEIGKKCFQSSGLKESDVVVHCLSYNMWMGGYTDHQSLEATGATVIPFGVGNTHNLIETILLIKPTAIHCTPSYLSKIELVLKNEFCLKPIDLGLKLGLFGAESGLQNEIFRKNIEKKWGMKAMNANYGMADVLSMFGAECHRQEGLHFMACDILYPEIISPGSLETVPIEEGNLGELVLTNLDREAQPLIRYRTNDIIRILSTRECECGNKGFKFEVVGRSDDMFVFKGVNVYINAIERVISDHVDAFSGHFQVFINEQPPVDLFRIHIELNDGADAGSVGEKLFQTFRSTLSISPEIIFVPNGSLPRTAGKSKKLFKTL